MSRLKQLLHTTTKRGAAYKFIERFALKHMSSTAPSELNQRSILLDKERVVTYAYSVQKISLFRALRQNMKLGNVDGWWHLHAILRSINVDTSRVTRLQLKRGVTFNSDVLLKQRRAQIDTLNTSAVAVLIRDLEHLFGTAVVWRLNVMSPHEVAYGFELLTRFSQQFARSILRMSVGVNPKHVGFPLVLLGARLDIDLAIDGLAFFFQRSSWRKSVRNYKFCVSMLSFVWPYYRNVGYCVSVVLRMSGKFSRHLLTQARDYQYVFGKPSKSTADVGCVYRYRQISTKTGVYGMHLWYYTHDTVKLFQTELWRDINPR